MKDLFIDDTTLSVSPRLACRLGLHEALVLEQLHCFLHKTESRTSFENQYWLPYSLKDWHAQFPFFSLKTLSRIFKSLKAQNLLIVKEFTKMNCKFIKWYTVHYEALHHLYKDMIHHPPTVSAKLSLEDNKTHIKANVLEYDLGQQYPDVRLKIFWAYIRENLGDEHFLSWHHNIWVLIHEDTLQMMWETQTTGDYKHNPYTALYEQAATIAGFAKVVFLTPANLSQKRKA